MTIASVTNLRHSYGGPQVLDGTTLSIAENERIGLVGRNGCGKSTLLKVLAGELNPDFGTVSVSRGSRIGYLSQHPRLDPSRTLREEAASAFAGLAAIQAELEQVYDEMATADGDRLDQLLKRQEHLDAKLEHAGGYAIDHRIDAVLHGLGFDDAAFATPVTSLSGGQKARLGLAKLLLDEPDLLLLDEPTNHLDIEGRRWLEEFLADDYHGAVVVVSHDRWLLDRVVNRIVEIDRGSIRDYPGNYEAFVQLRAERQLTELRVHEKQQDKIRAETQFIMRYKAGQRAKQARGRQTRLDRYKEETLVDRPAELDVMSLELPEPPRVGDTVAVGEHLTKAFGEKRLFGDFSLTIKPGDRIGIIGPNGAGKTTLVRTLLGDLESDSGVVKRSPRLEVGWFRQNQDHLDLSLAVFEYLQQVIIGIDGAAKASEQQARDLAGAFLFTGKEQDKVLRVLSGGERARAVLAGLVASAKNLLVLDEPTNHLDIPSAERLERCLLDYGSDRDAGGRGGALLLITHDRALLDAVCDRLVILDGEGGATVFEGGYREWLAKKAKAPPAAPAHAHAHAKSRPDAKPAPKPPPAAKSKSDPLARLTLEELEARIERCESEIKRIDAALLEPANYADPAKSRTLANERERLARQLEPLEFEWSRRAEGAC
jgi:ATP-binding cassette subfamily F protein 3